MTQEEILRELCREIWKEACESALIGGDTKAFAKLDRKLREAGVIGLPKG